MNLGDINIFTKEGKLLIAALSIISTKVYTDLEPDKVLNEVNILANKIYKPGKYGIASGKLKGKRRV